MNHRPTGVNGCSGALFEQRMPGLRRVVDVITVVMP